MSIKKVFFVFLFIKVMSGRLKGIFFVRKYAAIPVQLEIFILQYIGWCVLVIRSFILNQFGCFCHFLMDDDYDGDDNDDDDDDDNNNNNNN